MNSLHLRAEQRQSQTLSPRLQQAVRLLQLSSLDFAQLLREKMGRNPFLEGAEDADVDDSFELPFATADDVPTGNTTTLPLQLDVAVPADETLARADDGRDDIGGLGDMDGRDSDRELWQADGASRSTRSEGGETSALDMTPVEQSLTAHLHEQLILLPLSERDLMLARAIVESLDEDGYLRTPLDELAEVIELDPPLAEPELSIALKRVQSLDPPGVGARSVAECLRLQLPTIECTETRAIAATIVRDHLSALASRDIGALARHLGLSEARVEAVCDRIRRLDPRPGWRLGNSHAAYVVPDVIVKKVQGRWQVQLNPAVVPRVRLNQVYIDLFARHRRPQDSVMAEHLQDARWTVRNVEQRFCTILDVAQAIVRRQRHFFEYGAMAMKPLGLREIAEEVGIHESTVSRVTNNKYMVTPIGVFELKYFFSRTMVSANGKGCSGTAIRGLVKDILDSETPARPLSDAQITRQLAQQGLNVARRTVTKYRQMLKIESVDRRRRHA